MQQSKGSWYATKEPEQAGNEDNNKHMCNEGDDLEWTGDTKSPRSPGRDQARPTKCKRQKHHTYQVTDDVNE